MSDENKKKQEDEESKALKEAMSFVVGKRLPLPKHWSGEELEKLEFPGDLTRLSTPQLGELLGIWAAVMAYAQYETARTDIEKTARWNRYEFARKELYLKLSQEGGFTEEGKKSKIHVQTAKLLQKFELAKAAYTMMYALLGVYSKYYQALSRELSRRGLDDSGGVSEEEEAIDVEIEEGKEKLTKQWKE